MRNICKKCKNGVFLLPAYDAYEQYFKRNDLKATTADLISQSFPVSMIDIVLNAHHRLYYNYEDHFENTHKDIAYKYEKDDIIQNYFRMISKMSENTHHFEDFPSSGT